MGPSGADVVLRAQVGKGTGAGTGGGAAGAGRPCSRTLFECAAPVQGVARDQRGPRQVVEEQVEQRAVPAALGDGLVDTGAKPGPHRRTHETVQRGDVGGGGEGEELTSGADPGLQGSRAHHLAGAVPAGAQIPGPGIGTA